ncbi:hypothetical protein ABE522_10250 [Stenotrophomonas pennii]|uniref:hypothetical protein n=1 Tax=Stenotrophomonas lacuserhaii TaxID=2760084 RepID=UPI0032082DED
MSISDPPAGARPHSTVASRWLAPLLLFAVGFILVPWAHTCQLSCVPGDMADARFNGVVLEHFYRWLIGLDTSLLSPSFFYPVPGALTFSDNHWGTAWIYSAYRALGWDRYQAFDLWYLTGFVANYVVCHVVFRRLRFSPLASAVAAFAFTFAMPVLARHGHAQLTYRFLMPVALLLWQRFSVDGRWRWIAGLAVAVVAQFYASIYLGYFTLLLLVAWCLAQWAIEGVGPRRWMAQLLQWRQASVRRELLLVGITLLAAAAAMIALMYPYLHYSKLYGFGRGVEEVLSLLPRPQSYLLADYSALWHVPSSWIGHDVPMRHEQQIFFGVGILGLAALGLLRSGSRVRWVAVSSVVILMLLTMAVGGHSLYLFLAELPGIGSIRAMARIGLVLVLPLSLLVALGVESVRTGALAWKIVAAMFALMMVVEAATLRTDKFGRAQAIERIEALRGRLPSAMPDHAILFNPAGPGVNPAVSELDGVILAQDLGRPTLNGYSGNIAPGYHARDNVAPCVQALYRITAATGNGGVAAADKAAVGALENIVVLDPLSCKVHASEVLDLANAAGVSIQVASMSKSPAGGYLVSVRVINNTAMALNTQDGLPQPLRLSWQLSGDGAPLDPGAWSTRVDLAGSGILAPQEVREVSFLIPEAAAGQQIGISAVLEGRAWLHDHGLVPTTVPVGGSERSVAVH